jgi:hypothetical protein
MQILTADTVKRIDAVLSKIDDLRARNYVRMTPGEQMMRDEYFWVGFQAGLNFLSGKMADAEVNKIISQNEASYGLGV